MTADVLRGRVVRWEAEGGSGDFRLFHGDEAVGDIRLPRDLKPAALAEIAGASLKIVWTEHAFYRIATAGGLSVGEARFLPWRRDTFQARLGHLRAYRLTRPAPGVAAWQIGGIDAVEFRRAGAEASLSPAIEAADMAPLLALGVLLWAKGELFAP